MDFASLKKRLTMDSTTLALLVAGYLTLACNLPFFAKVIAIFKAGGSTDIFFAATLPLLLWALLSILLLPLSFRRIAKPVMIVMILLSAAFSYTSFAYGVIFDDAMFTNIFETDAAEARQYVNAQAMLALAASGVLPALLAGFVALRELPLKQELKRKAVLCAAMIAVVLALVAVNYDEYAVVGRNNRIMTKLVVPLYPLKKLSQWVHARYFKTTPVYEKLATDAHKLDDGDPRPRLVLMVLGETQRAMNYSLNGYGRETNPYTAPLKPVSFRNVTSFGTSTAVSVPFIFSMSSRDYDGNEQDRDNVIDVTARAGVKVLWRDNDSGCKKACKGAEYVDVRKKYAKDKELCPNGDCYDAVFIKELAEMLPALEKRDTLVVFHIEGAHGPGYFERYPEAFKRFTPDCPRTDVQNCSRDELVNTYDNTILYDDHVMAELMKMLAAAKGWDAHFLFLSDHGESLGENGLYLHSFPRRFAPAEQTHVPLIYWQPQMASRDCVAKLAAENTYDRINLADTLLGLSGVGTASYSAQHDMLASCRKQAPAIASGAVPARKPH